MGPALPYVCLFCKFNVLLSILSCSIEAGGPNRGGVPAGSAVRGFVLQLLCLAFWSLPSVRVGIDRREHLYLYCNTAGAVSHGLWDCKEVSPPHSAQGGGQAPTLHFPLPTHGPLSCIGVLERVSRLVQAEAWPGGGLAIRDPILGDSRIAHTVMIAFGGTTG